MKNGRSRLVSDDDGHWFIIPADKWEEWEGWLENPETTDYTEPKWARYTNTHPSRVTFTDWTIG